MALWTLLRSCSYSLATCLPPAAAVVGGVFFVFVLFFVRITRRGRSTLASFRSYTQERKTYQLELEVRAWSSQIKTQAAETISPPHL